MLTSVFEDREGSIWVGTATTGLTGLRGSHPHSSGTAANRGILKVSPRTSVTAVYSDSQENLWVGSAIGLTRIDGKTGKYSFFRKAGRAPATCRISS